MKTDRNYFSLKSMDIVRFLKKIAEIQGQTYLSLSFNLKLNFT